MKNRNTSQDPEFEGPTFHEKRVHPTHFQITRPTRKRKEGARKRMNGVLYVWKSGKWNPKEMKHG
jgi:hypothetical protein